MTENQCKKLNFEEVGYPDEWKVLSDAPKQIQYFGDSTLLQTRKFTVVGSRTTPVQAKRLGKEIAGALSSVFTLVTGVADGGDEAAIEGALEKGGRVICVLAGGFSALPQGNLPLLREVAKKGLLLSPFPFEETVKPYSYEYRNKLLAYLGEGTLVLGAAQKSGALITAKYAKRQQKRVFALPYAPNTHAGEGCNALIKQGAYLTETVNDVLENMGLERLQKVTLPQLNSAETQVLNALKELSEGHVNELSARTGIPVFKLRAVLSALEVKGAVANIGGNRYAPV